LIAQKADGALRDALSIFDLMVTFSEDRNLTYKKVIENLHVLDYDYYFKITDSLLSESVSEVLLTFDEILRLGFDGHNFLNGLTEHFRNLLVCKDAATVRLLEVSESVQQKYVQQAKAAPLSFILSALNIGNSASLNYKESKNQRLHIELTLIKMASIPSSLNLTNLIEDLKKKF
jgi:DNA polymerase III subunit gamma/tau